MPMSPRLLRPIASGLHPEVQQWRNAVISGGGSASGSTLKAMSDFCRSIDAAGLRDRFYRLNLFCGNSDGSLAAVRRPLYRGPSSGGTQFGNVLDQNVNFVSGDYAETGSGGGLTSASGKYLRTGMGMNAMPNDAKTHMSVYLANCTNPSGNTYAIGVTGETAETWIAPFSTTVFRGRLLASGLIDVSYSSSAAGLLLISSLSTAAADIYGRRNNASPLNASSNGFTGRGSNDIPVCARLAVGAGYIQSTAGVFCGYSIGIDMSTTQSGLFYSIMQSFQTALGRQV